MSADGYIAGKRHFTDAESVSSLEHFFEQLDLDLEWALGAAQTFRDRDGRDPAVAAIDAIRAIAGRRYHRFKVAEEEQKTPRAEEMRSFAQFWYHLAQKLEELGVGQRRDG